jgi:hypothetical protein
MKYGSYDIGETELANALSKNMFPDLLNELVGLSRQTFGWFNKRQTRVDEYVWVVNKMNGPNNKVLDIGSGVSPLPIYIASQNNTVITIDNSNIKRTLGENQNDWNGWGFLDYNQINKNICSYNIDISQANFDPQTFDFVYSVSVIEHLSSNTRKQLWKKIYDWSKPSGNLLLTIDLIPETNYLWNFESGREVEDIKTHGDIDCLVNELQNSGFFKVSTEVMRGYKDSQPTDLGLLHFTKR